MARLPGFMLCQHHSLKWRHNERYGVSNHQPHDFLLNRLFRRTSKKTPKLRVTGLCAGNSPVTGEFPAQMATSVENVSIWWRHHDFPANTQRNNSVIVTYISTQYNVGTHLGLRQCQSNLVYERINYLTASVCNSKLDAGRNLCRMCVIMLEITLTTV